MTIDLLTALEKINACPESRAWLVAERLRKPSALRSVERWDACPRGDWLLWLACRAGVDRRLLVLAACACARLSLRYVPAGENRPRLCIEVTERWCRGEATLDEVRAARSAASAYAAADASAYAAYAADAAYAASAASAAADAAYAADVDAADATDVDAADATYAAAYAAREHMRAACADAVRAIIPWAVVERGIYDRVR